MVLGGLLTAHAGWALGSTLSLPGDLGPDFLLYSSQGYLGVDLKEIDPDRVTALRLKDTHGAEVVMVDHDAPAGKSGLKVHDVILQLDGQPFDNAEQLRRRLREMPSGRTITLLVSRDGNPIYVTVQFATGRCWSSKPGRSISVFRNRLPRKTWAGAFWDRPRRPAPPSWTV